MPVVPREASSLILLREAPGAGELEVLMVERHANSAFAGGMYVFPGGMVDEEDCDPEFARHCAGLDPRRAADVFEDPLPPPRALGFFVAAVRELFEEAGILLAYEGFTGAGEHTDTAPGCRGEGPREDVKSQGGDHAGTLVSCRGEGGGRLAALRSRLRAGGITFHKMVEEEGLRLALDRLTYFAHWVTPEIMPVRFDTRFFLAPAPPCQDPLCDEDETASLLWIAPGLALELCREGRFPLLPPTVANLWELTQYATVKEALAAAREKEVTTIMPYFGPGG
ncbi:MAG: NUDIX hydrolase [Actinobacteria bacterium]|nr:NUDIX hydrolase [Actinomycetota bacterium]